MSKKPLSPINFAGYLAALLTSAGAPFFRRKAGSVGLFSPCKVKRRNDFEVFEKLSCHKMYPPRTVKTYIIYSANVKLQLCYHFVVNVLVNVWYKDNTYGDNGIPIARTPRTLVEIFSNGQ